MFRPSNLPFYALFLISFSGEIIAMRFFITKKEWPSYLRYLIKGVLIPGLSCYKTSRQHVRVRENFTRGFITSKSYKHFFGGSEFHLQSRALRKWFHWKLTYAWLGNRLPEFLIASKVQVFRNLCTYFSSKRTGIFVFYQCPSFVKCNQFF